jgi:hypothetical protein
MIPHANENYAALVGPPAPTYYHIFGAVTHAPCGAYPYA